MVVEMVILRAKKKEVRVGSTCGKRLGGGGVPVAEAGAETMAEAVEAGDGNGGGD